MAKIQTKKINVNDFSPNNRADIERLGRSLNPFFDEVTKAISNQLNFEYITFDVIVDNTGVPTSQVNIPVSFTSVKGIICIAAINSAGISPTSSPFISFNLSKSVLQLNSVTGLPANNKFTITALVLG